MRAAQPAASTSPEGVAPASKCRPSTARTITRRGSRFRARPSSIASWSPNAWVDIEQRNRAGSGSLLTSNRRIVPGASPDRIASTSTTASRPCHASSKSFASHSRSLTSIPVCIPRSRSRRTNPSSRRRRRPAGFPTPSRVRDGQARQACCPVSVIAGTGWGRALFTFIGKLRIWGRRGWKKTKCRLDSD
jgi:hypothetical protein